MSDLSALKLVTRDGAVRLEVRAKPRAHKSAIVGVTGGALDVALAAPPVDGAANEELVTTLARACGVSRSQVSLVRGEGARTKLVAIEGIGESELRARLEASGKKPRPARGPAGP
jgi:uncharacterized protein (TIGR00251 family)